jgi:hypothetical protein
MKSHPRRDRPLRRAGRFAARCAAGAGWLMLAGHALAQQFTISGNASAHTGYDSKAYQSTDGTPLSLSVSATGNSTTSGTNFSASVNLTASSVGFVEAKAIGLGSFANAVAESMNTSGFGLSSSSFAQASVRVPFTVAAPSAQSFLAGTPGYLQVPLHVTGAAAAAQGSLSSGSYTGGFAYANLWATGISPSATRCPSSAPDRCVYLDDRPWLSSGVVSVDNGISSTHLLNIPFVFGSPSSYRLELWTSASATAVAAGVGGSFVQRSAESAASFGNTVAWGGINGVFTADGTSVSGWTISSLPGVDLTTPFASPVPEPATWLLMAAGLAGIGASASRQRKAT